MIKKILIGVILLAALAGGGYWYWLSQASTVTTFRFEEVNRGRLVATVGATGTLQPREVVDVGAQVVGRIVSIGKDSYTQSGIVDWGSEVQGPEFDKDGKEVKPGTLLAQIDDSLYLAQRNSAQAALQAARAAVEAAEADVKVKTASLSQSTADWGRAQKLFPEGGIAQAEYDQFKASFEATTANLAVSKANLNTSKAQVAVAEANLKTAKTNLDYTKISAPVTGIVIDRRVNIGQTVVASLSAPSLFLIAKDLTQMEVWATVNEVDIGKIQAGAPADFTVDSNPSRVYHGQVVRQGKKFPVRFNANMTQNVVTYTVAVSVNNDDLSLYPYQTANVSFVVQDKPNALLVPNSALRWQPTTQQIAPDQRAAYLKLKNQKHGPTDPDVQDHGLVWTQGDDGYIRYTEVHTGLSDGVKTEIVEVLKGAELPEKTRVIVGEEKKSSRGGSNNPFSIQMFRSNKPKEQ
jgi:HlyD family secretion protein